MKPCLTSLVNRLLSQCCGRARPEVEDRVSPVPSRNDLSEDSHSLSVQVDSDCDLRGDDISVIDLEEHAQSANVDASSNSICEGRDSPKRTQLPPLRRLLRCKATANMQDALRRAEEEENANVPSPFMKPSSNKLAKHLEQELKSELVQKKKAVKVELNKVRRSKKRALLEETLRIKWSEVDEMSEEEMLEAKAQHNNAMIAILERELELLKEKQNCKKMEYDLLCKKDHKGVISETVQQCKALKLKCKHSLLEQKITEIKNDLSLLKKEAATVTPPAADTSSVQDTQDTVSMDVQKSRDSEIKKKSSRPLLLFIGESHRAKFLENEAKQMAEKDCLLKFQERCEAQSATEEDMPQDSADIESESFEARSATEEDVPQDTAENESEYSFNFEEDVEEDGKCLESNEEAEYSSPRYPLYRCTRLVPLHKLLPKLLEIIEEETDKDLMDYEEGVYVCKTKFIQSCKETNADF